MELAIDTSLPVLPVETPEFSADPDPFLATARAEHPWLANEVAFFLFEGSQLAWIGNRVADIPQRLQELLRASNGRIVFNERLLMREAHGDPVDSRHPAERFFDGAGAERAVQSADARANVSAVRICRGLISPWREGRNSCRCVVHCIPANCVARNNAPASA